MLARPVEKLLRHRAEVGFAIVLLVLLAAVGFASYQRLFSSFAAYDDEGYVMLSLRQFMDGRALYDDVYSQYGPAYYWLSSLFHMATDWPVTHDVTRIKTLAVWLGVSALSAAWLYRVTGSTVVSVMGLLLASFHLERLAMEPGHPQELCLLAVAVCLLLATFIRGRRTDLLVAAGFGLATAVCAMTKVNVGVCLVLPLSAAMLMATRSSRWRNWMLACVVVAMVVLPLLIGRHELLSWHGYRLPILLTMSAALTSWICTRVEHPPLLTLRHVACYWGTLLSVALILGVCTIASGTSFGGLANGLLLQHLQFVERHYHDPPIHALAALGALLSVMLAPRALTSASARRAVYLTALILVAGAAIRHLVETFEPLYHGSQDRGQTGLLVSFFLPFVWIILLPPLRDMQPARPDAPPAYFARLTLCLVAVLQPLIAYPVPGTQMAIGSLPLVVALLVAIHDAAAGCHRDRRIERAWRTAASGIVGLLLLTLLSRDACFWAERSRLPSLHLAGANRLRLPPELAAVHHWTVGQLRERAETFLCLPSGQNSLYLWSGIAPPTGFNATVWQDLLTDQQQQEIIAAIEKRSRVVIVVERNEPSSLRNHGPLLDHIRSHFTPVTSYGTREIWQRNPITLTDEDEGSAPSVPRNRSTSPRTGIAAKLGIPAKAGSP